MSQRDALIEEIHSAFTASEHQGEAFLQGSFDGHEPNERVPHSRKNKKEWRGIEAGHWRTVSSSGSFANNHRALAVAGVRAP